MSQTWFWNQQYEDYYQQVSDVDSLVLYKKTLEGSFESALDLKNRIYETISGASMNSKAGDELKNTLMNLFEDKILKIQDVIESELGLVLNECDSLKLNLEDLIKEDKKYDRRHNKWENYQNQHGFHIKNYSPEEKAEFDIISSDMNNQRQICVDLKEKIEENINKIKEFNDLLENFSITLITFEYAIDDCGDFKNLSVSKMKELINDYERIFYNKKKQLKSNEKDGLVSVLNALGYPYDLSLDGPFNFDTFMKLHSFINTPIEFEGVNYSTPIDILRCYFEYGESWEESGMYVLAMQLSSSDGIKITNCNDPDYEAEFWRNMIYEIDGRELDNCPTPYFLFSTDYYKEFGGCSGYKDIYDILMIDPDMDELDPNYNYYQEVDADYTTYRTKYKNLALFDSLKKQFVEQGYLDGLKKYCDEINATYDEYGEDVLPFLEALDGRMDWSDNNSVIPADAIIKYINGASWEESELSLYCSKSESEFIADLNKTAGKDYSFNYFDSYEDWNEHFIKYDSNPDVAMMDGQKAKSGYELVQTNGANVFEGCYNPDELKARLKEKGIDTKIGNYYGSVGERNNQINEETIEMYGIASSIRTLEENVAKTDPTPKDLLRKQNKEEGKKIAGNYFDIIDGISGKSDHVHIMTQEEYIDQRKAENPSLTENEIMKEYVDAWKEEYRNELINDRNYNPECARRMAENADYSEKKVVKYDNLNALDSVLYFGREVGADIANLVGGTASGTIDIGRSLKHVVAPDAVPTALQYAQDEISSQYNNPNSEHYDPVKGTIYSVSRAVVREGTDDVLKMIPGTHSLGVALEFLEKYGGNVQANYSVTGNYAAAQTYALGNTALDATTKSLTNSLPGGSFVTGVVGDVVTGEAKLVGGEYLKAATGMQSFDDSINNIESKQFGVVSNAVTKNMDFGVSLSPTGNKRLDQFVSDVTGNLASGTTKELINVVHTGDLNSLNLEKVGKTAIINAGSNAVKNAVADGVNEHNIKKEMAAGLVYQDNEGNYVSRNINTGEEKKVDNINEYLTNAGYDSKSLSKTAASLANVAGTETDKVIGKITSTEDNDSTIRTDSYAVSLDRVGVEERNAFEESLDNDEIVVDTNYLTASLDDNHFENLNNNTTNASASIDIEPNVPIIETNQYSLSEKNNMDNIEKNKFISNSKLELSDNYNNIGNSLTSNVDSNKINYI